MVTIMDIAREASVSPSTVSLVSNGTGYVADDTRQRVQEAIERLGYRPRRRRRAETPSAPAADSPDVVVIYVRSDNEPRSISANTLGYIDGINEALQGHQIRPSLIAAADRIKDDPVLLSNFKSRRIDGALLVGVEFNDRGYIQHLVQSGIPVVVINRSPNSPACSSICVDYARGSQLAIDHLVELGHKRIGFAGWSADHWPTTQRYQGYQQAMTNAGLEPFEPTFFDKTEEQVIKYFCRTIIDRGCTGLVMSDSQAELAVPVLEGMGKRVPDDLSVVGFDALNNTTGTPPRKLSSIGYDKRYIGQASVEMLMELIASEGKLRQITKRVAVEFIEGETTGPA